MVAAHLAQTRNYLIWLAQAIARYNDDGTLCRAASPVLVRPLLKMQHSWLLGPSRGLACPPFNCISKIS